MYVRLFLASLQVPDYAFRGGGACDLLIHDASVSNDEIYSPWNGAGRSQLRHALEFIITEAVLPFYLSLPPQMLLPIEWKISARYRLRAAKQSFTSATDRANNITRRRIGLAGKRRSTPMRKGERTESWNEDTRKEGNEEEEGKAPKIQSFPTGLVVSKNFTETRSGREIFMLEVKKRVHTCRLAGNGARRLMPHFGAHLCFVSNWK